MSTPKPDPFPEDEPSIFDQVDEEAERLADERAEADIAAGRVISHEAMMRWIKSWGTPEELPPPEYGE
jgi:predicted transcriptional regulator